MNNIDQLAGKLQDASRAMERIKELIKQLDAEGAWLSNPRKDSNVPSNK